MSGMPDTNKILAAAAADLIKTSFNSVSSKATNAVKNSWQKIFEDFEPFMKEAFQRNNYVRLLSQKEKDVELYDVYIECSFKCAAKIVTDETLIHTIRDGRNVVINGNGGAGKTFFMRHLWLTLLKNPMGLTPLFIELRKLNELSKVDLISFVRRSISRKRELDDALFNYFCDQGRFCFVLDGYDEVQQSQREALQSQILDLSASFPECRFVVSSRYENRFAGWQNFELYESVPFNLKQVRTLVQKVPFDDGSKKLFFRQLNEEFYEENVSFLSNPLLCIMMMMTFKENMDIPKRMNIFYDQAFTTLYTWHDATKAFSRPKILDIDAFQKSFAVFCLLTYYKEKYEFTKTEVIDFIKQSNKLNSIGADVELILSDYEEAVNLLKQDGLVYVFIHRSFQEYFAAYAMVHIIPNKFPELLPAIRHRVDDNVVSMCYEMNRGLVVQGYIEPCYNALHSSGKLTREKSARFYFLEILNVRYDCHLGDRSPSGPRGIMGMSMDIDQLFSEFAAHVNRICGVKHSSRDLYGMMLDIDVFMPTTAAIERSSFEKNQSCRVSFSNGNVVVDQITDENGIDVPLADKIILKLKAAEAKVFLEIDEKLAVEARKISNWCKEEIQLNAGREKSLKEILDL